MEIKNECLIQKIIGLIFFQIGDLTFVASEFEILF